MEQRAAPELRRLAPEAAAAEVAEEVSELIFEARGLGRPLVLGLATGATMRPLWAELARRHREQGLSFGRVQAFALDEYCGLDPAHPARMRAELEDGLLAHIDLPPEQLVLPDVDGDASLEERCRGHERRLREAGGIDLQLLGVGSNGHVAFNEPGAAADSRTRRVHLAGSTRAAATSRFGSEDAVPSAALTVGIATILEARRLRLLAFGSGKARAVRAALVDAPTDEYPVSHLRGHADLRVYADAPACAELAAGG